MRHGKAAPDRLSSLPHMRTPAASVPSVRVASCLYNIHASALELSAVCTNASVAHPHASPRAENGGRKRGWRKRELAVRVQPAPVRKIAAACRTHKVKPPCRAPGSLRPPQPPAGSTHYTATAQRTLWPPLAPGNARGDGAEWQGALRPASGRLYNPPPPPQPQCAQR